MQGSLLVIIGCNYIIMVPLNRLLPGKQPSRYLRQLQTDAHLHLMRYHMYIVFSCIRLHEPAICRQTTRLLETILEILLRQYTTVFVILVVVTT